MRKFAIVLLLFVAVFSLASCGRRNSLDTLTVFFVPSRDAQYILDTTAPLAELLKAELALLGFEVGEVIIEVGTSYEAVGEGMIAGTVDVGFLPGGTYALYSQDGEIDVILASTRGGLNKDSANAIDWNDGLPTTGNPDNQVTYYRSLLIAGPSPKGVELANKVNAGQELTWEDLNSATWCIQGPTSSAGTVYPSVALYQSFQKRVSDLASTVNIGGYGPAMAALANGTCDVATAYADARRDYGVAEPDRNPPLINHWETTYGREASIWVETNVIMVTDGIFNDTISVSNATVNDALKEALQQAFINIIATEAGQAIFEVYNHQGYKRVTDEDYEAARIAIALQQGN